MTNVQVRLVLERQERQWKTDADPQRSGWEYSTYDVPLSIPIPADATLVRSVIEETVKATCFVLGATIDGTLVWRNV